MLRRGQACWRCATKSSVYEQGFLGVLSLKAEAIYANVRLACQVEESLGDFDAARADTLALVGLPPDAPHVPQRLPVDVQHIWAHMDMAERDLLRRCTRCARRGFGGL